MGDRVPRRSVGAPFYAPPRRKTSAEIISEARAAIFDGTYCDFVKLVLDQDSIQC